MRPPHAMTFKIELPPEIEATFAARAEERRMALPDYLRHLLEEQEAPRKAASLSPAERAPLWRESANNLPRIAPLSDEAMSGESFYDVRGWSGMISGGLGPPSLRGSVATKQSRFGLQQPSSGLLTWGIFGQGGILVCHFGSFDFVSILVRACFRDLVDGQNKLTFGRRVSATSTMFPLSAA